MSSAPQTCILMPTCERYRSAAALSISLLDKFWPSHPPIVICGLERPERDGLGLPETAAAVPLQRDSRDWIGITLDGARAARDRGYTRTFLILDDQGPIDTCNSALLDRTLHEWMGELGCVYVGLLGWEQGEVAQGETLGARHLNLMRHAPNYRWRFALTPAIWTLDVLIGVLEAVASLKQEPPARSCWYFEKAISREEVPLPAEWNARSYRLSGRDTAVDTQSARPWLSDTRDRAERAINRTLRGGIFKSRLGRLVRPAKRRSMYIGAYPMHVSGFLDRGRPISRVVRLLRLRNHDDLASAVSRAGALGAA